MTRCRGGRPAPSKLTSHKARARADQSLQADQAQLDDSPLTLLVVSSGLTELSLSIQDIGTLIFEIQVSTFAPLAAPTQSGVRPWSLTAYRSQELRHMTSAVSNPITTPSSPSLTLGGRHPSTIAPGDSISAAPSLASRSPSMTSELSLRAVNDSPPAQTSNGLSEVDQLFLRLNDRLEAAGAVSTH